MKKWILRSAYLSLMCTSWSLSAANLIEIYQDALHYDPVFQEASSTYLSRKEAIPQAWSALLPQMSFNPQVGRNYMFVRINQSYLYQATYDGTLMQASLSQAIFNAQAWNKVQQANSAVKAAQATFNDAAQNLIFRTAEAYFKVLFAQDNLNFANRKMQSNKRHLHQAKERYKKGIDAITTVYEARAGYNQAYADVISAEKDLIASQTALHKLTNKTYDQVAAFRSMNIPLPKPVPANPEAWVHKGMEQNYRLLSAKYSMESAKEAIKAQNNGHLPTLTLQGTGTQISNDPPDGSFFVPNAQKFGNLNLMVKYPIFQGGLVVSQTRQAIYDYQTAGHKFEQSYQDVLVNSKIAFMEIMKGIRLCLMNRKTIKSREHALEATIESYKLGTRNMVDIVNAEQRLYEAQLQLAKDQYAFVTAILNLKYLAGTLQVSDLVEINQWLGSAPKFNKNEVKV